MKMRFINSFVALFLFFVLDKVSSVNTERVSVPVKEGDSVTLNTNVETNQQDDIKWYFKGKKIAGLTGDLNVTCIAVQCNENNGRFRDRLKLDKRTGSLTITNITNEDAGDYQLKIIIGNKDTDKIFSLSIQDFPASERKKTTFVNAGESTTLDSSEYSNNVMTWYFNDSLIVKITGDKQPNYTDQSKEIFGDRLKVDHQTGSLIITNPRTTDSGEYTLEITISHRDFSITRVITFSVTVTGLPSSGSALHLAVAIGVPLGLLGLLVLLVIAVICYRQRLRSRAAGQNEDHVTYSTVRRNETEANESSQN